MSNQLRPVNHTALQVNQMFIIAFLIAAFIADAQWLVSFVALVMLLGTILGIPGFQPLYRLLKALRGYKPQILMDNPQPHRFSQGFGGLVLLVANLSWLFGSQLFAWGLAWLVIALAALNLFSGFCLGCALYYWLNRLGLPGFSRTPPPGTSPGRRPPVTS